MKQERLELGVIDKVVNAMEEILGDLLLEFDDDPDLFEIDFDFA